MKTVLVLTAIERTFYSSAIEYQLIEPLLRVASKSKNIRFLFLALVPITFYFVRSEPKSSFFLFRRRRKEMEENLKQNNFNIFFIPVLFPIKHKSFYLNIFEVPLFILTNLPFLLLFQWLFHPLIIHSRGYPAGLLAFINKKLNGTRFLFDMRDVYTKKGIEAGVFKKDDITFRFWNSMEKKMVFDAEAIIVTSFPFSDYVADILRSREKICIVPNSVNMRRFFPDNKKRAKVRERLGIKNRFVLIHSGTFSTPEDIQLSVRYFKKWKSLKAESFFLVLTPNKRNIEELTAVFKKERVDVEDFKIINPEPEEVSGLLKVGDIGLHLESKALATEYCIAIKDGEYLATGLPVVCTPYLKGIAPLIEKYNVGIVTDPDKDTGVVKEKYLLNNLSEIRKGTRRIVNEVLSLDVAVQSLSSCYEKLL